MPRFSRESLGIKPIRSSKEMLATREALADLQPEMDPKNRAIAFDIHRLKDSHRMHLLAMWMIFVWSGLFSILYRRELDLAGTLWPSVFKLKLTAYLSIALMHFVMWKSFSEEKAKYVFGYLGELKPDTALILLSGYTTVVLSFDDHRFVALLDSNESYASQITKSFELNPERPVPTCGGYAPGGKCYFNNIEASNLVLLLGHTVGMGFGFAMDPIYWWRLMHFACLWYAVVVLTFGHMLTSTGLMMQNVLFLYGNLLMGYEAMKRQNVLIRHEFELILEVNKQRRLERETMKDKVQTADAHRAADSRLNHVIKGKCGAARMYLELFQSRLKQENGKALDDEIMQLLLLPLDLLDQAAAWCHRRQFFVQLEEGTYSSSRTWCDVSALFRQLLSADHGHVVVAMPNNGRLRVDESALSFAVEEGLSNARKNRSPGSPLHLNATVEDDSTKIVGSQLHVTVSNLGKTLLTPQECARAFEPGYKTHVVDASSDGLGLESVRKAVVGADGQTWLDMTPVKGGGGRATLHIILPVEVEEVIASDGTKDAALPIQEKKTPSPPAQHSEVKSGTINGRKPIVCCVDDSDAMRNLLDMIIEDFLDAEGPGEKSGTLGATRDEQNAFVDVALGKLDLKLQPREPPFDEADITVIDQNLWAKDEPTLLGTELVRQLRAQGFAGVCCILTGASDEEITTIASTPGVDLALPKTTSAKRLAERCWLAAAEKHGEFK